jgi:hypothetical protein
MDTGSEAGMTVLLFSESAEKSSLLYELLALKPSTPVP